MLENINIFYKYIKVVFIESWQKAFTLFDVLGIVLFICPNLVERLPEKYVLVRVISGALFFFSFLLANFVVYKKNACREGADIYLKVIKQFFKPLSSGRSPFRDVRNSEYGFNDLGLPDWATLYAEIEITNIGFEEGRLKWELVEVKTKLPPLFDRSKIHHEFNPHTLIPARDIKSASFFYDVQFTVRDPHTFAREVGNLLHNKKRYQISIRYLTKRVDGETKPRELRIEGDFSNFYDEVITHWKGFSFEELVELSQAN